MATIKEDFVSFETAKLLKEKNCPDFGYSCIYDSEGNKAQTQSIIMKWLREVHKIDVWVEGWNRRYKGYIHSEQRGEEALFYEDSYEVACEEAIKHCLENLI